MFVRRQREPGHLELIVEARQRFRTALTPRITEYESRLDWPWYQQVGAYVSTNYGAAGYKRTQDFLKTMEDISRTEGLIDLTKEKKYLTGKLAFLLHKAVVEICSFDLCLIEMVETQLIKEAHEIMASYGGDNEQYPALDAAMAQEVRRESIEYIYKKIIESQDYGEAYLQSLNARLSQQHSLRPLGL